MGRTGNASRNRGGADEEPKAGPRPTGHGGARERRKELLRQKIVQAARALITETGSTGLSMRALAVKAGVGHVTPYNLFGSKQAVLLSMLDADLDAFRRALDGSNAADPIAKLFEAARLSVSFWLSDPAFYRTLYSEVFNTAGTQLRLVADPRRDAFWRQLVDEAIAGGAIDRRISAPLFSAVVRQVVVRAVAVWISRNTRRDHLEAELGYGLAVALLGIVSDALREGVRERLFSCQARLLDHRQPENPASGARQRRQRR